jgi:hypothetical protein
MVKNWNLHYITHLFRTLTADYLILVQLETPNLMVGSILHNCIHLLGFLLRFNLGSEQKIYRYTFNKESMDKKKRTMCQYGYSFSCIHLEYLPV